MSFDLRFAVRFFARRWVFSVFVIAVMATASAIASVVFAVYDQVVVRPLPFPNPDRLVVLDQSQVLVEQNQTGVSLLPRDALLLPQFDGFGIYDVGWATMRSDYEMTRLRTAATTSGLFRVLGVPALVGRTLEPQDDHGQAVVVLGFDVWTRQFNRNPGAIGTVVRLNERPFTIVGVMPQGFSYPEVSLWVPPFADRQMTAPGFKPTVIARLRAGVLPDDAVAALSRVRTELLGAANTEPRKPLLPLRRPFAATYARVASVLSVLIALLLAAACANVAGLLVSLMWTRQSEFSIRLSQGASRARLIRQLAVEGGVLAGSGAAAGVALGYLGWTTFVSRLPAPAAQTAFLVFDLRAAATGIGVVLACVALVCSIIVVLISPSWTGSTTATAVARTRGLGHGLIVLQSAVALCLMAVVSAMQTAIAEEHTRNLGFSNDHALVLETTLPGSRYSTATAVSSLVDRLAANDRPGRGRIAFTDVPPGSDARPHGLVLRLADAPNAAARVVDTRAGRRLVALPQGPVATVVSVSTDYFTVMGGRIVAGRPFTDDDTAGSPPVAILSESAARQLTEQPDTLTGKALADGSGGRLQIVGIVGDVTLVPDAQHPERKQLHLYRPFRQRMPWDRLGILLAPTAEPGAVVAEFRRSLNRIDPFLPLYNVRQMGQLVADTFARERFVTGFAGIVALLALGLTAAGVFGTLTQLVSQRMREFGVRVALGAAPQAIWSPVVRSALMLVLMGSLCGTVAGIGGWELLAAATTIARRPSGWTLLWCALAVEMAALLAASAPARRASKANPADLLRSN